MLIVGLTGSLGTGKTTVASFFAGLGAKILDADEMSRQLTRRQGLCFKEVVRCFGKNILKDGSIDRKKLSAVVFNNPQQLKKLTRIIHPSVIRVIKKRLAVYKRNKSNSVVVVDAPLLIEAGLHRLADVLVVVKANRQKQIARVRKRLKIKHSEAVKRIQAQMPIREKMRLADAVIDNRGSLVQTKKQVEALWQKLQTRK